jgi:hypothetical protein
MSPAVCPLSAPSANYRTDPASQIDRNDRTMPVQQAPRAAAMEAFFQPNRCRRIGVWPRGDQVRRTGGISETADSSKKTI